MTSMILMVAVSAIAPWTNAGWAENPLDAHRIAASWAADPFARTPLLKAIADPAAVSPAKQDIPASLKVAAVTLPAKLDRIETAAVAPKSVAPSLRPMAATIAASLPPRYWIHLTNEPGIRALGRIENGVAVDIVRRERIANPPVVQAPSQPAPWWEPPRRFPMFGASPMGGCANGMCPR